MACAMDIPESWKTEKHEKAKRMQLEVKLWMKRNNFMVETGISYPEGRLTIYLPPESAGKDIQRGLLASHIEGIEQEADFAELKKGKRKKLAMYPGRTQVHFGDGSSATLGTFLQHPVTKKIYALTSQHSQIEVVGRDVFVRADDSMYRLGRVLANVKEQSPVVDACLIEVDVQNEEMYEKIKLSMYFHEPTPPLCLKMHRNADNLGIEGEDPLKVSKYGYATQGTFGFIKEYSRDIIEDGHLLTDNIVTVSEDRDPIAHPFAAVGDSGAVVLRSYRTVQDNIHFYDAISMLYMADENTGESFSIPLPRCLSKLGVQIGCQLELATQNPPYLLNPE